MGVVQWTTFVQTLNAPHRLLLHPWYCHLCCSSPNLCFYILHLDIPAFCFGIFRDWMLSGKESSPWWRAMVWACGEQHCWPLTVPLLTAILSQPVLLSSVSHFSLLFCGQKPRNCSRQEGCLLTWLITNMLQLQWVSSLDVSLDFEGAEWQVVDG